MMNEMTKQAGCTLMERVKIAAAIVAIHNYDRTQDIIGAAGEIKKTAALQGVNLTDEQAIFGAQSAFAEMDQAKKASFEQTKTAKIDIKSILGKIKNFASKDAVRIPGMAAAGAGVGAGGAALAGETDPKTLALAGLLGGSAGAFMGLKPGQAAQVRQFLT